MTTVTSPLVTTEEFLAMPDDGIDRDLIHGRIRVYGERMTRRNRRHSRIEAKITFLLREWLESQPEPRGEILVGEAGARLLDEPDTTVGIDVAYISAETAKATPEDAPLVNGAPVLAVEVLSPSDKQEDITDKIRSYLDAGTAVVWIVEPVFQTVQVYRPHALPVMFNISQNLAGDADLPGFSVPVAALFKS